MANIYIGPPVIQHGGTREKFSYDLNETCSLRDPVHYEEVYDVVMRELVRIQQPQNLVADYRETIREALNRRVAIMFQQLVCCYQTGLTFELGWTSHQGASAPALKVRSGGRVRKIAVRNAAHSSTIPCLIAVDGQRRGIYMKNADTFRWWNSTINMPKAVNEADREIDEKRRDSTLRTDALALLNRAARGEITPQQGLMLFLNKAVAVASRRHRAVTDVGVKEALGYYVADFADIKTGLRLDPAQFDQLLDVQVDRLRKVVYRLRYKAIQWAHTEQSKLLQKIEALRTEVAGSGRKPVYFEAVFRHLLVEVMPTPEDKRRIKKLYNAPGTYAFRATDRRYTRFENTKEKVSAHINRIRTVGREISLAMCHLRVEEQRRRGGILRSVRNEADLSQKALGTKLKAEFSTTPASQSTISRSETGVRLVTQKYASQLSKVLKIDTACFMPQFWFSGV